MLRSGAGVLAFLTALIFAGAATGAATGADDKTPASPLKSWLPFALALKPGQKIDLMFDATHHVRVGPVGTTVTDIAPDAAHADVETYGIVDMGVLHSPPDSLEF